MGDSSSPVPLLLDADAEGNHDHEVGEPDGEEEADEGHYDLVKLVQRLCLQDTSAASCTVYHHMQVTAPSLASRIEHVVFN